MVVRKWILVNRQINTGSGIQLYPLCIQLNDFLKKKIFTSVQHTEKNEAAILVLHGNPRAKNASKKFVVFDFFHDFCLAGFF